MEIEKGKRGERWGGGKRGQKDGEGGEEDESMGTIGARG